MSKEKNYRQTEKYMEHCMDEFSAIKHDNYESELENFLDVEFNKCDEIDILLTYDFLIELCRGNYQDFFRKLKFEFISQLSLSYSYEEIQELYKKYNNYFTSEMNEYPNMEKCANPHISIIRCSYCGKPIYKGNDCYHIDEAGEDYCYEEINDKEGIQHTCIGKELLRCGYSLETIWFMLGNEYNEYSKAIEDGTVGELESEDGNGYPEIFYTTTEE